MRPSRQTIAEQALREQAVGVFGVLERAEALLGRIDVLLGAPDPGLGARAVLSLDDQDQSPNGGAADAT